MNYDLLKELQEIVESRRAEHEEGSYTAYLFDQGLDKILKKLGEETTETIVAAKNLEAAKGDAEKEGARTALEDEAGDMLFHLVVMLDILGIDVDEVEDLLRERMKKKGNLKESLRAANDNRP